MLIRKALAEFAHERLLVPEATANGRYVVRGDDGLTRYEFTATVRGLDHWQVDADSITATAANSRSPRRTSSSS